MIACPPRAAMPASKEKRVRVEVFEKSNATDFGPSSGRYLKGSCFSSSASSKTSRCSCGLKSSRSEEHTSELQSRGHLVCRLLLEKKKTTRYSDRQLHT